MRLLVPSISRNCAGDHFFGKTYLPHIVSYAILLIYAS